MESKKAVIDKIRQLTNAVMSIPDCVGFCYTQLTDVEQEVNGLLDHNHQYKFDPEIIKQIMTATHQNGFDFNQEITMENQVNSQHVSISEYLAYFSYGFGQCFSFGIIGTLF